MPDVTRAAERVGIVRQRERKKQKESRLVGPTTTLVVQRLVGKRALVRAFPKLGILSQRRDCTPEQLKRASNERKRAMQSSPGHGRALKDFNLNRPSWFLAVGCISARKKTKIPLLPRRQRHGPSDGRARRSRGADDGLAGLDDGAGVERLELDADGLRGRAGGGGDGRRSSGASRDRRWPRGRGRSLREGDDGSHCFLLSLEGFREFFQRVREFEFARESKPEVTKLAKKKREL